MNQRIELTFAKDLSKLAGNKFGRITYETQVKNIIDFDNKIIFVFPSGIDRIASSFIQGFFDSIILKIGINGIDTQIEIESEIPDLKKFILDNLE